MIGSLVGLVPHEQSVREQQWNARPRKKETEDGGEPRRIHLGSVKEQLCPSGSMTTSLVHIESRTDTPQSAVLSRPPATRGKCNRSGGPSKCRVTRRVYPEIVPGLPAGWVRGIGLASMAHGPTSAEEAPQSLANSVRSVAVNQSEASIILHSMIVEEVTGTC